MHAYRERICIYVCSSLHRREGERPVADLLAHALDVAVHESYPDTMFTSFVMWMLQVAKEDTKSPSTTGTLSLCIPLFPPPLSITYKNI